MPAHVWRRANATSFCPIRGKVERKRRGARSLAVAGAEVFVSYLLIFEALSRFVPFRPPSIRSKLFPMSYTCVAITRRKVCSFGTGCVIFSPQMRQNTLASAFKWYRLSEPIEVHFRTSGAQSLSAQQRNLLLVPPRIDHGRLKCGLANAWQSSNSAEESFGWLEKESFGMTIAPSSHSGSTCSSCQLRSGLLKTLPRICAEIVLGVAGVD